MGNIEGKDAQELADLFSKHKRTLPCYNCQKAPTMLDHRQTVVKDGSSNNSRRFKCQLCNSTKGESDMLLYLRKIESGTRFEPLLKKKKIDVAEKNKPHGDTIMTEPDRTNEMYVTGQALERSSKKTVMTPATTTKLDLSMAGIALDERSLINFMKPVIEGFLTPFYNEMNMIKREVAKVSELQNSVDRITLLMAHKENEVKRLDKMENMMENMIQLMTTRSEGSSIKEEERKRISQGSDGNHRVEVDVKPRVNRNDDSPKHQRKRKEEEWQEPKKTSRYSDVLKNVPTHLQKAGASLLESSNRFVTFTATKDIEPRDTAEYKTRTRVFHIHGLEFMRISNLKKKLAEYKVELRKIYHIEYVGKAVIEILVDEEYAPTLEAQFEPLKNFISLTRDFDARKFNKINPTSEQNEFAEERFCQRMAKILSYNRNKISSRYCSELIAISNERIKRRVAEIMNPDGPYLKTWDEMDKNEEELLEQLSDKEPENEQQGEPAKETSDMDEDYTTQTTDSETVSQDGNEELNEIENSQDTPMDLDDDELADLKEDAMKHGIEELNSRKVQSLLESRKGASTTELKSIILETVVKSDASQACD
jgi:hypothetical protein